MAWIVRGTGEGLSVGAPFGWREWPMGLMVVRGRWGAREKVSWCFGWRGRKWVGGEGNGATEEESVLSWLSAIREKEDTERGGENQVSKISVSGV